MKMHNLLHVKYLIYCLFMKKHITIIQRNEVFDTMAKYGMLL